ncbi:hypothetical protein PIB30_059021 [Stylosanthes scabra]|uniref:Uncharacterized protein n=1 Tax=Stylosanthes scabra TaxID=79078 RepID=A0ABU6RK43_9FABA|nr:hypothetical protein [Stylosanthes scabra]
MRMPAGQNVIDEAEKENGANCSAEDSGVAKGKVVDVGSAYLTKGSSAVVGTFAERMWTAASRRTAATMATELLFLEAIFPWDLGREHADDSLQWRPEVSAEDRANATEVGEVGKNGDGGAT